MADRVLYAVEQGTASSSGILLDMPNVASTVANPPAVPFLIVQAVPNASTNIEVAAPCDLRIVDVWAVATANGAAGDLVQVFNGATAVTDALDLQGADQAVVRAATINDASQDFSAGDTILIDPTSATNCSCQLYILCIPN